MGGPQVNGLQLLAARQLDIAMADALQVISAIEQNVPVVAIAATFQKNPTVIIAHPGVAQLEDLKGKPIAIGAAEQHDVLAVAQAALRLHRRPEAPVRRSRVQPFLADTKLSQQGFATSEPFSIEKGGVKPRRVPARRPGLSALFRSAGRHARHARQRSDVLRALRAAHRPKAGRSYLANPAPGNALIKQGESADERRAARLRSCAR